MTDKVGGSVSDRYERFIESEYEDCNVDHLLTYQYIPSTCKHRSACTVSRQCVSHNAVRQGDLQNFRACPR